MEINNIKTAFEIGSKAYYMKDNKIVSGEVEEVSLKITKNGIEETCSVRVGGTKKNFVPGKIFASADEVVEALRTELFQKENKKSK